MRRGLGAAAAAVVLCGVVAACGSSPSGGTPGGGGTASASGCTKTGIAHKLFKPGVLTVATDNPVYTPWFVNNTPVKCLS